MLFLKKKKKDFHALGTVNFYLFIFVLVEENHFFLEQALYHNVNLFIFV